MKNKKIVIISLILVIVVSLGATIYILVNRPTEELPKIDGIDTAENSEILKDSKVENLDITNISLLTSDGISTFTADVTNNTTEEVKINNLYVVFNNNDREDKILALIDVTLKPSEKTTISITSEIDLSKTNNIKYLMEPNTKTE